LNCLPPLVLLPVQRACLMARSATPRMRRRGRYGRDTRDLRGGVTHQPLISRSSADV
jgi:hypothetical protein